MERRAILQLSICLIVAAAASRLAGADWPMWRYDACRTAASPERLPDRLELLWAREFAPRKPVWDDPLNRDLMAYDRIFEPVIADGRVIVGFNDRDKVAAYDAETGNELWVCRAGGPVRLPPAVWQGQIFFASDGGHLYCVDTGWQYALCGWQGEGSGVCRRSTRRPDHGNSSA